MIHARDDYNRIQDPALKDPSLLPEGCTAIGEDEPVCLFRAQDKNFVPVLEKFAQLLLEDPDAKNDIIASVEVQIRRALEWQQKNGCKTPDLPRTETKEQP